MVAAPQSGTMVFVGLSSGKHYNKDVYCSDVVAALIRWDSGQGASATSDTFWTAPEAVVLKDFTQVTGMTDTTKLAVTVNQVPTGDMVRFANHLNTLNNRPLLNIGIPAGSRIGGIQLA